MGSETIFHHIFLCHFARQWFCVEGKTNYIYFHFKNKNVWDSLGSLYSSAKSVNKCNLKIYTKQA